MNFLPRSLLALLLGSAGAVNLNAPILPDARMTPGDVLTSDPHLICQSGYTKTVRNVPTALKNQVYQAYGITHRDAGEIEIDHLVSLELGGSNSVRNLWPESYKTQPLNAHVKDSLENALHAQMCGGKITVQEAQQAIAGNWTQAYTRYVGPLPGGAQPAVPGMASANPAATQRSASPAPNLPEPGTATRQGIASPGNGTGTPPGADGSCPANAPIKVSTAGIFHLPQGDSNYARTHAKSCFVTPEAAVAAGFRGVR